MRKLKEYLKIEDKIERLTTFLDDNGHWQNECIDDNEDYKNMYYDCVNIHNIYLDECEDDIKKLLKNEIDKNGIDFLFNYNLVNCEITLGYYCLNNELWSFNIGEVEVQYTGLYDYESNVNCIYSELIKDMNEDEIKEAKNNCEFYVYDDCIYIDRNYDRVSFILNEDDFLKYLKTKENK